MGSCRLSFSKYYMNACVITLVKEFIDWKHCDDWLDNRATTPRQWPTFRIKSGLFWQRLWRCEALCGGELISTADTGTGARIRRGCVNPLHVGELISTADTGTGARIRRGCVNPLHVGELISTDTGWRNITGNWRCQSPSRRGTHFYGSCVTKFEYTETCVNPLHVGELISTLTLIFCWFYAGFQPRFPGYFPDNSENGCFFGHFNIFRYFL